MQHAQCKLEYSRLPGPPALLPVHQNHLCQQKQGNQFMEKRREPTTGQNGKHEKVG